MRLIIIITIIYSIGYHLTASCITEEKESVMHYGDVSHGAHVVLFTLATFVNSTGERTRVILSRDQIAETRFFNCSGVPGLVWCRYETFLSWNLEEAFEVNVVEAQGCRTVSKIWCKNGVVGLQFSLHW